MEYGEHQAFTADLHDVIDEDLVVSSDADIGTWIVSSVFPGAIDNMGQDAADSSDNPIPKRAQPTPTSTFSRSRMRTTLRARLQLFDFVISF